MYYVNSKQEKILQSINKFGCMTYEQIKKLSNLRDLDKYLKSLIIQKKLRMVDNNIYTSIGSKEINKSVLSAIDLYIYLSSIDKEKPIIWCVTEKFPFIMAFFRNNKVFDISAIKIGEETIYSTAINRSTAERIIVILEDTLQIQKIKINRQVKYCTISNGAVIFFNEGGN